MAATIRRLLPGLAAACLLLLPGCSGVSHNPSYFPWSLKPFGDIVRTHAKPTGEGAYADFDPHACRVEVRPLEAVSSVRNHYVLIATVYDDKGEPRRGRRVEWMLEGAGNVIEVDESGCFPGRGYKVDNHYAVSYTDYLEHHVTRGNDDPNDDFVIRPGQSWCVISAAVEGDTHVTVYCPEIYNWDSNKVVVTTHWVDAAWTFPKPVVARGGSEAVLNSSVVRATDKQPLAGYKVRYRILDGPPAVFLPGRTQEYVATSDLSGNAPAALAQDGATSGVNRVGVEIIRAPLPTRPSDAGLELARGETTVTWQAPVITLDLTAPPAAVVGQELTYTVALSNTGTVESSAMTVRAAIPDGTEYVRSDPAAVVENNGLVWTLGELSGRQTYHISATVRPSRVGAVTNKVQVETAEGLRGEKSATTDVTAEARPALKVGVEGPAVGAVGAPVAYQIVVSNPGTGPATGVVLTSKFDPGLEHESKVNPVESQVGTLAPGTSKTVPLTLTAREAGAQTNVVTAEGDGGLSDSARQTVTVKRAEVSLHNTGPAWRYVGRPADWKVEVKNIGDVPLANVVVRDALSPELAYQGGSPGAAVEGNQVTWAVGTLEPGETRTLTLTTLCKALTPRAMTVAGVTADPGIDAKAAAPLEIRGLPAVRMKVADRDDPVEVGKETEYRVEVTNQGSLPAEDVQVVAVVPDEMRVLGAKGPATAKIEAQRVTFPAVGSLPPGQAVVYTIQVQALKAAPTVYFRAELTTNTLTKPLVEEESTSVLPGNGGEKPPEVPMAPAPMGAADQLRPMPAPAPPSELPPVPP
ncbi:MAG TPA: hypothetical protein VKA46_22575 [Gemmataceae bacterium]|nr:hypothetical protein [Gemmataceae bacterium]